MSVRGWGRLLGDVSVFGMARQLATSRGKQLRSLADRRLQCVKAVIQRIEGQEAPPTSPSKFFEEQIAYSLRSADGGAPLVDVCRQIGVSEATFYAWKKKYAQVGPRGIARVLFMRCTPRG
jgi:hypothetical protein